MSITISILITDSSRIITDQRKELTEKEIYDVVTALRGPDDYNFVSSALKTHVTARLRTIVFYSNLIGTGADINYDLLTDNDIKGLEDNLYSESYPSMRMTGGPLLHYLDHLIHAVRATKDHPIWNNKVDKLLKVLMKYTAPGANY